MAERRNELNQVRMVRAKNNSSSLTIPAYGLVRVVSVDTTGLVTVDRPNVSGEGVMVTSSQPIQPSGYGAVTRDWPTYALYESGDGTPATGESWGAGNGTYKLRKNVGGSLVIQGGAITSST